MRSGQKGRAHPHLALTGAEVEVEAAFEALVDEAREGGHGAEAGVLLREEAQLPLLSVLLLPCQFLEKEEERERAMGTVIHPSQSWAS